MCGRPEDVEDRSGAGLHSAPERGGENRVEVGGNLDTLALVGECVSGKTLWPKEGGVVRGADLTKKFRAAIP